LSLTFGLQVESPTM